MYKQEGGSEPIEKTEGFAIGGGTIGLIVLAAAIVAFIVQNTNDVQVDWLFFNGEWPLWLVVIATIALTLVAERLGLWLWRRTRRKED